MRTFMKRRFVAMALFALTASWPLRAVSATLLPNDLTKSSNPNATAGGQVVVTNGPEPETYGTSSNTWYVAGPWDAQPIDSSFTYTFASMTGGGEGIAQSNASGSPWVHIPVHLPNGALWTKIQTEYCDTGTATMSGFVFVQNKLGSETATEFLASSGTPGCIVETATFSSPITIDNDARTYYIEVNMGGVTNASIILGSMRLGYMLQVSPAPSMATFSDVPTTDPFFRFVEALYASGITAGCGGGKFCPDAPLTRGEMAVFLSVALGLHWPN